MRQEHMQVFGLQNAPTLCAHLEVTGGCKHSLGTAAICAAAAGGWLDKVTWHTR